MKLDKIVEESYMSILLVVRKRNPFSDLNCPKFKTINSQKSQILVGCGGVQSALQKQTFPPYIFHTIFCLQKLCYISSIRQRPHLTHSPIMCLNSTHDSPCTHLSKLILFCYPLPWQDIREFDHDWNINRDLDHAGWEKQVTVTALIHVDTAAWICINFVLSI